MNIEKLAEQAGLDWHRGWTLDDNEPNRFSVFALLVAAHEREECIKALEKILLELGNQTIESAATKKLVIQCANIFIDSAIEAIKARSKA